MEKRNFFFTFSFFLILSFLIFALGRAGLLSPVNDVIGRVVEPVRSALRLSTSAEESELLKRLGQVSEERRLQSEMQALRDQFESGSLEGDALLPTRIIGSPTFIPGITAPQRLIVDKGEEDGVKKGMAAVTSNNLVGVVSEVHEGFSKVTLITNGSFSITARAGEALGVVRGGGSSRMVLGNVDLSSNLNKNDIVYSSGNANDEGIGILPDLIIGRIVSVDKKASDIFQKAEIESAVDFESLTHVFLVLR